MSSAQNATLRVYKWKSFIHRPRPEAGATALPAEVCRICTPGSKLQALGSSQLLSISPKLQAHLILLCFTSVGFFYKVKARHSTSKKIAMALLQYSIISVVWTGTCNISQVCSTHPNHTHSPLPYVFSIKGWKTVVRNVKTLFSVHGWLNP